MARTQDPRRPPGRPHAAAVKTEAAPEGAASLLSRWRADPSKRTVFCHATKASITSA